MPKKEQLRLAPDKLGLSTKDCIYLILFRELKSGAEYLSRMYEVVQEELKNLDKGKGRSYFYETAAEMERFGWITLSGTEGKKKQYILSPTGIQKMDWFRQTYYESISNLKGMADYFAYIITGIGNRNAPELTGDQLKLFNRLINVRHLTRYLFMKILYQRQSETAVDIWRLMQEGYHWRCGEGYIYEMAHEMEAEHKWINGRWMSERRTHYVYRMTDEGNLANPREEEAALHYIRNLQGYTKLMLRLFDGEHFLTKLPS